MKNLSISIVQSGLNYELRINGFPFNHLLDLKRNKEFFNNITVNDNKNTLEVIDNINKPLFNFKIKPINEIKNNNKANLNNIDNIYISDDRLETYTRIKNESHDKPVSKYINMLFESDYPELSELTIDKSKKLSIEELFN